MNSSAKKTILFILGNLWIIATRAYDAYSTYQYTPDLTREANPLVTVLGISSWTLLLSIIVFLVAYIIYAWYCSLFGSNLDLPSAKNLNFKDFVAYYYFGKPAKWYQLLYKLPSSLKRNHQMAGVILPPALMVAGLISTIMWFGINNQWEWYIQIHSVPLIWSLVVIGGIVPFLLYCHRRYYEYIKCAQNN